MSQGITNVIYNIISLLLLHWIFSKKKKKASFALVIASACSGDISYKESQSNGGSKPTGCRGIERGATSLGIDPEPRPWGRETPQGCLKDDGARCSSLSRAHFFLKRWKLLLIKFPPRGIHSLAPRLVIKSNRICALLSVALFFLFSE